MECASRSSEFVCRTTVVLTERVIFSSACHKRVIVLIRLSCGTMAKCLIRSVRPRFASLPKPVTRSSVKAGITRSARWPGPSPARDCGFPIQATLHSRFESTPELRNCRTRRSLSPTGTGSPTGAAALLPPTQASDSSCAITTDAGRRRSRRHPGDRAASAASAGRVPQVDACRPTESTMASTPRVYRLDP